MKNYINTCAATLHLNAVKYAHPDIITNCVYNTAFQLHCSLRPVYREQCKTGENSVVTGTTAQSFKPFDKLCKSTVFTESAMKT